MYVAVRCLSVCPSVESTEFIIKQFSARLETVVYGTPKTEHIYFGIPLIEGVKYERKVAMPEIYAVISHKRYIGTCIRPTHR